MWSDPAAKYQGPDCTAAHSEWARSLRIPPEHYSVGSESSPVLSCTQTQATEVRQASLERGRFNPFRAFLSAELAGCTSSRSSSFFFFFFWEALNKIQLLENSCSTILCLPLPHINMNQPQVYICPLPPKHPSSHLPPHPTLLACHRAPGWAPCCHTENSRSLSILRKVMYVFPRYSPNLSHSPLPPLRPQVCFLCLHFRCCPLIGSSVPSF